jgi:PAS domain S-box-containing protein
MAAIRVLIVEDDDEDARLIVTRLRRGGVDLVAETVTSATQLRTALRDNAPDLVISDYNLPAFTAEDALQSVREHGSDAPFILVSGQVGEDRAAAMMKAGAGDFILKDRMDRLVPVVQRELRDAEERRQRRAAENALRDSERRFRLLAEHSIDVIFRYRLYPDRGLDYISPAVAELTGHRPEQLYTDPNLLTAIIDAEDRPALEAAWSQPRPTPIILRGRHRDGRPLWIEQRTQLILDERNQPIAVEGVLRDVTEQHAAELERQRLDHQLRQAERLDSLGHLAGGIAHDFNNILAVITAYAADIGGELGPDHPCHADVQRISHAADRAAALTRQLLIFSRLEPSRPETVDLNHVITDTEHLLHRTIGEDVTFISELEPGLRPVVIDRSKLEQVIVNLVVNARAAMPDGGQLTITTRSVEDPGVDGRHDSERPGRVWLSVADTGCGMTPEVVSRAFEPFFTTKGPGSGTGLGLATAYGVITEAGGDIHIESVPGQGTTMIIVLPAVERPAEAPVAAAPGGIRDGDGGARHVIVVEDDTEVRDIVVRILSKAGYRVTAPATPAAALQLCTDPDTAIDALVTDVIMPETTGPQLANAAHATRPHLPVLYISGYTAGNLPGGHTLSRNAPLLPKPFTAEQLRQAVAAVLDRTRQVASP